MDEINFFHLNCKELSWIYGPLLSYYQLLKQSKFVRIDNLFNLTNSSVDNDSYIEVAYKDNQVIGFIHYHLNEHYKALGQNKCEITLLTVFPQYRNQNIGSILLKRALLFMINKNINTCFLYCSKNFDQNGYTFWINKGAFKSDTTHENGIDVDVLCLENLKNKL